MISLHEIYQSIPATLLRAALAIDVRWPNQRYEFHFDSSTPNILYFRGPGHSRWTNLLSNDTTYYATWWRDFRGVRDDSLEVARIRRRFIA